MNNLYDYAILCGVYAIFYYYTYESAESNE